MREDELPPSTIGLLFVLRWESQRAESVTVDEIVRRLGMSRGQAVNALTQLYDAGFLEVQLAGTQAEGGT